MNTPRYQRGVMALMMAILLIGLLSILSLITVAQYYWAKRDAQKVADMAALSGVQHIDNGCSDVLSAASVMAKPNWGSTSSNKFIVPTCGNWNPAANASPTYFKDLPASASTTDGLNAVQVVASVTPTTIIPESIAGKAFAVNAKAIAINTLPIVVFSVGSQTAGIDPGSPLNDLLNASLGTSLGLGVLNDTGISRANISLLSLVKSLPLNVGTLDSVLNTDIPVAQFLDVYLQALSQQKDTANLDLTALQNQIAAISAKLGNVPIHLGQILDVHAVTSNPAEALNANINALNILQAVVLAADSNNAVAIPPASADVPLVAHVSVMASVIEPPQIGVGGVGTTAHTAQIRLALDLKPLTALNLLGLSVGHLSLGLEVAPSSATVTNATCNVPGANGVTNNVTIQVTPGVANVGIANYNYLATAFANTNKTWASILGDADAKHYDGWDNLVDALLAKINLFTNAQIKATPPFSHTFAVNPATPVADQPGMTYPSTLSTNPATQSGLIVSSLLESDIQVNTQILGVLPITLSVGAVLNALSPLLNTLLAPALGSLVNPLLQAVGIEVGTAQVTLQSFACHGAQLVY